MSSGSVRRWLAPVLFAVLGVGSIIGLVVGVVTHSEAGLVQVCANSRSILRYAPPARCDSTRELRWPRRQFPLLVYTGPQWRESVMTAMRDVNRQLGFTAFRCVGDEEIASVVVILDVPRTPGWMEAAGAVMHRRDGADLRASVEVSNVPDVSSRHFVIVHELGHVLGLDHDDFRDSAMFPSVTGRARFTDSDRALLRRLYGERS